MKFCLCALLCGAVTGENHPVASVAMSLEGGGWRAQTVYAGIMSGMLASLTDQNGHTPSLASSGLLNRFDHFSSVSGGSWFFASMAYSNSYNDLISGMGASPSTSASQMNEQWTTPITEKMDVDPSKFDVLADIAKDISDKIIGKGDTDSLFMMNYFLATNASWNAFVVDQLSAGASIDSNVKMGSNVVPWAKDKIWLAHHSVLLPTGDKFARLYQNDVDSRSASYVAKVNGTIPTVTPAKFSIKLGAGEQSSAPHKYFADAALPSSITLDFEGQTLFTRPSAVSEPLSSDLCDGALTDLVGNLPVGDVASASSAAAGIAPVMGLRVDEVLAMTDADLTPWVSNTADGSSFGTAIEMVSKLQHFDGINEESMHALAAAKVHGLIDGAYTDNTGLAAAVAAGASEVVVLLDNNATVSSFTLECLFQGGPAPDAPEAFHSPIFKEPSSIVTEAFKNFHRLNLDGQTYLKAFVVGSLTATTMDNVFFGVAAGRTVTMHVIELCADITIGSDELLTNYNTYVQEIVETLASEKNAAFVKGTLQPMFLGSSHEITV